MKAQHSNKDTSPNDLYVSNICDNYELRSAYCQCSSTNKETTYLLTYLFSCNYKYVVIVGGASVYYVLHSSS